MIERGASTRVTTAPRKLPMIGAKATGQIHDVGFIVRCDCPGLYKRRRSSMDRDSPTRAERKVEDMWQALATATARRCAFTHQFFSATGVAP